MRRSRTTLSILFIALMALTFSSCSWIEGGGDNTDDSAQSTISIDTTGASDSSSVFVDQLAPQDVTIELGELNTWNLKTDVTYNGTVCITASINTQRIDDEESAQKLDLGGGLVDTACNSWDGAQTKSFTSTLVAGKYFVVIGGQQAPINITVTKGDSNSTEITTEKTDGN
jgi:hypothetical protein